MIITRFNPSVNGPLHLGHIYSLLVNERFAHDNDGKFYIRFDDSSQAITIEMDYPEHIEEIIRQQTDDIKWLGIPVDGWSEQTGLVAEVKQKIYQYDIYPTDPYPHTFPISVRMGSCWIPYPYTPYQTAERVIMDNMLGITHIIRGEEFLTEYSLYRYFCEEFKLPTPEFIFLPRLQGKCGDISKTNGGYTIKEMRGNGYTPAEIIRLLEIACLNWRNNGWSIYNLKPNPYIDL